MKKIRRKGKAEGSVLFTVVAVMMVMVVFLMSTLVLTTSANRRSYYTFYENQAQYTAQGVLDAISNSAYSNQQFHDWVVSLQNEGDRGTIDVNLNGSNIPVTRNSTAVTAVVERVNQNYIWDAESATVLRRGGWKITVTASVGQGRNASEYTMANYIYENPEVVVPTGATNDANWSVLGELEVTPGSQNQNNNGKAVTNKAKAMFLGATGNRSTNNNLLCLGPQTYGNRTLPAGRGKYAGQSQIEFTNNPQTVGDGIFIGNFKATCSISFVSQRAGEGVQFWGDFYTQNMVEVFSDISDNGTEKYPSEYRYIPYFYVDGKLSFNSDTSQEIGRAHGTDQPVNMYLGSLSGFPQNMTGDIYLYDPDASSDLKHSRGTHLYHFTKDNVQKTNSSLKGIAGGDIICNNASLKLSDKMPEIGGDIIYTNPDGSLTIEPTGDATIYGAILCAGDLNIVLNNQASLTVAGGVYADPAKTHITGNGTINGKTDVSEACDEAAKYVNNETLRYYGGIDVDKNTYTFYANSSTEAHFESLGGRGATGTDYGDLVKKLLSGNLGVQAGSEYYTLANNSGYDFSMFPFCSRQDEIFDRYYRFDLAAATSEAASDNINNDNLCKESKACGHEWGVEQKNYVKVGDNGSYTAASLWVPFTCPKGVSAGETNQTTVRNSNKNSFISKLETYSEAPISSEQYINDAQVFKTYGSITTSKTIDTLSTKAVSIHSHTAGGDSKKIDLGTVPVIDDNMELSIQKSGSGDTPFVIFVDPTQKHSANNPLCILIKGEFTNQPLTIVVNNNSSYKTDQGGTDYSDPKCYGQLSHDSKKPQFAGKTDVLIFFDQTMYCNKNFVLTTSGAYQMMCIDYEYDIISNPLYPGKLVGEDQWELDGNWDALWGTSDACKFELVPNIVVYGQKGNNYCGGWVGDHNTGFQNGCCISAEIIMPDSDFASPVTCGNVNSLKYREFTNSTPYDPYANTNNEVTSKGIMTMGSMMVRDVTGHANLPISVFLGDLNRPGTTSSTQPTVTYSNQSHSSSGNATAGNSKDFFNNDHQGLR